MKESFICILYESVFYYMNVRYQCVFFIKFDKDIIDDYIFMKISFF